MPTIDTLIPDIYEILETRDGRFTSEIATELSNGVSSRLRSQLGEGPDGKKASLRLSGMGPRCPRTLWYSVNFPELRESLPPWAHSKFALGHIHEAWGIALCKAAGHTVTGEQDELWVDGVAGHRDAVVDGCIVDFKSCSSRSFEKFKNKSLAADDPFGYLDQVDGYVVGSLDDPLVTVKDKGYLFAMDKTLGHMCLYEHTVRVQHIRDRIESYKRIVGYPTPPECTCGTKPQGKSGNIQLDTRASYNIFKYCCFPDLRTFIYADGPVYLSKVVRKPDVPEIDRYGKIVYN